MTSKITVIVPVYKVEKYIDKCLKSLHNQTFKDFEVWAVDDGSPDNSDTIIKKWEKLDSRIKYIYQSNGGYGSVLEYCINNISSEYFLICDPDDWLKSITLEKLFNTARKNNLDMVVSDKYNVYVEDNKQEYIPSLQKKNFITPNKVYDSPEDIQRFSFLLVSPHAKLYKTKIAKGIHLPKHVSFTDFDLYIMSLVNTRRILYLNEPLAYYLIDRPGNTTTTKNLQVIESHIKVWECAYKYLENHQNIDILWWRMYAQLQLLLCTYSSISKDDINDKFKNRIFKLIENLQNYKNKISAVAPHNLKFRILFNGMMNHKYYKLFGNIYIRINNRNEIK